jgi:uncharacterized protein YciI
MYFVIVAKDSIDSGALERRLRARDEHLELCKEKYERGQALMAAALLDQSEKMNGSVLIVNYPSKAELEEWLKTEPYIRDNVWDQIEIYPCKIPDFFLMNHKDAA